jgi:hypothetical protein
VPCLPHRSATIQPDVRQAVYVVAAAHGGAAAFERLLTLYADAALSEEKVRVLRALGCTHDAALAARALAFATSDAVRSQDLVFVVGSVGQNPFVCALRRHRAPLPLPTGGPRSRGVAWTWLQANWDLVNARYGKGGFLFSDMLQTSIDSFVSLARRAEAEAFFRAHPGACGAVGRAAVRDRRGVQRRRRRRRWRRRSRRSR